MQRLRLHQRRMLRTQGIGSTEPHRIERCGDVREASSPALKLIRQAVQRAFGYDASFVHFPIVGVCPSCTGEERR